MVKCIVSGCPQGSDSIPAGYTEPDPKDGMPQAWVPSKCKATHIFTEKLVVFHFCKGPELRTNHWRVPCGIRTRNLYVMRRKLYRCAKSTTTIRWKQYQDFRFTKPNFCWNFQSTWWHRPKFLKPERFIFQKCKKETFQGKSFWGTFWRWLSNFKNVTFN